MKKIHSLRCKTNPVAGPVLFVTLSLLLIFGCKSSVSVSEVQQNPSSPLEVVVLPFRNMFRLYGRNLEVRSPISGKVFLTGDVIDGAEDMLLDELIRRLEKRTGYNVIPTDQARGTVSKLLADNPHLSSDRQVAIEAGRELGADTVIIGNIYRFEQRVGTRYGIESAASVAFDIYLLDVKADRVLWDGDMNETQRALSENLFQLGTFMKRKGRWITAEEMALSGLDDIFRTFP